MRYIDFHTHWSPTHTHGIVAICNLDLFGNSTVEDDRYYTVGIHPWESHRPNVYEYLERVEKFLNSKQVIGLGEVGLDKLRGTRLEVQIKLFSQQVELAQLKGKPTIVHCVRAWDELIALRKKYPEQPSWAVHGFSGSPQLAGQLLNAGFYLSVGAALLKGSGKIRETLTHIPLNMLFLETDDSGVDIRSIYRDAARLLGIAEVVLIEQLNQNFTRFFEEKVDLQLHNHTNK